MSQEETRPSTIRHFQRGLVVESNFGTDHEHESVSGAIVAVTLLSLLTGPVAAAAAQESSIYQTTIPASDPASQQFGRGEPEGRANPPERGAPELTASKFDAVTLPPIESIVAQTDITVFLQSGVPVELRHAALRRAWTVDPAILDFKGLEENDWNFNDPNSIPGFGELGPEVDVKIMVARILVEASRVAARPLRQPEEPRTFSALANAAWVSLSRLRP